jgi:hypothetical protein
MNKGFELMTFLSGLVISYYESMQKNIYEVLFYGFVITPIVLLIGNRILKRFRRSNKSNHVFTHEYMKNSLTQGSHIKCASCDGTFSVHNENLVNYCKYCLMSKNKKIEPVETVEKIEPIWSSPNIAILNVPIVSNIDKK